MKNRKSCNVAKVFTQLVLLDTNDIIAEAGRWNYDIKSRRNVIFVPSGLDIWLPQTPEPFQTQQHQPKVSSPVAESVNT